MKLPVIWPVPPVIGDEDARRRNHLAVEHDGERLADIVAGHLPEALAAAQVEAEIDVGFAGAAVEAGLRVDEILARHHHALLDRDRARTVRLRQRLVVAGRLAGVGDEPELELGGGAEQVLQLRRVLQARHLDEHAVGALLLDVGLLGAGAVQAAVRALRSTG